MQVSNAETRGLGGTVEKGRPSWEKGVVGTLAMHRRVVVAAKREPRTRGRMGYLLPEIFPPMGRLGQGNVGSPKKLSKKFSDNRGDLMTVEDSRDKGGVVGVRYNH